MLTNWKNFDYVCSRNNMLLVTVGESWTWGDSLNSSWLTGNIDNNYRIENVFGNRLAKKLNADFLNISEPGQSNLWIVNQLKDFCDNIENFNYKRIVVVVTLTEVGREFNGDLDQERDYTADIGHMLCLQDLLDYLSKHIENELSSIGAPIELFVGTNFVDSNYSNIRLLNKSWIDVIADATQQQLDKPCYIVGSKVFEKLSSIPELVKLYTKEMFITDCLPYMEKSMNRTKFLLNSTYNYKLASMHPTAEGHELWADYLYREINDQK